MRDYYHEASGEALGRTLIAGLLCVTGISRLGLITSSISLTTAPAVMYGLLCIVGSVGMFATLLQRNRWLGRGMALYSACVLAGLGIDVLLSGGSNTSGINLLWFALGALAEGLGEHDC
jgi:hypothetical protein